MASGERILATVAWDWQTGRGYQSQRSQVFTREDQARTWAESLCASSDCLAKVYRQRLVDGDWDDVEDLYYDTRTGEWY